MDYYDNLLSAPNGLQKRQAGIETTAVEDEQTSATTTTVALSVNNLLDVLSTTRRFIDSGVAR